MPVLGMPTLIEAPTIAGSCALCRELGLSFVELNMNLPAFADVSAIDREELRKMQEQYGIFFTLHLDERMDLCDFNPLVRHAYQETLKRALELAMETQMPLLNMHFSKGVYFTLPDRRVYLYEQQKDFVTAALLETRELVQQTVGNEGTRVCIENTEGLAPYVARNVELLLSDARFGLTLDVGHRHVAPERSDYEAFYAAHEEKLLHIHLHDAINGKNHLPLGTGEMAWEKHLQLAEKHHCTVVVEVKTIAALRQSIARITGKP